MEFLWCDGVIGICVPYIYVYFLSSPYLLMFGDDRVRDTREQMMLQVDLVTLSSGAGKTHGNSFIEFYHLWFWNKDVIYYEIVLVFH